MSDVKWIKLSVNMFDDEKIKLIKTMPEGDKIVVIWVQLLCLAGKTNDDGLVYMGQNMAYTDEMLATIFDEKLNIVRIALNTLEQFGMIEIDEYGRIGISNWEKHQNIEGLDRIRKNNADRQQVHYYRKRLKEIGIDPDKKEIPNDAEGLKDYYNNNKEKLTLGLTSSNGTEEELELEEELEEEKETKKKSSRNSAKAKYDDNSSYMKLAQRLFKHLRERNPEHREPSNWQNWADDMRKLVELDKKDLKQVTEVLDWCQQDDFWKNNILSPVKFRKQYDQLYLKMNQNNNNSKARGYDTSEYDDFF